MPDVLVDRPHESGRGQFPPTVAMKRFAAGVLLAVSAACGGNGTVVACSAVKTFDGVSVATESTGRILIDRTCIDGECTLADPTQSDLPALNLPGRYHEVDLRFDTPERLDYVVSARVDGRHVTYRFEVAVEPLIDACGRQFSLRAELQLDGSVVLTDMSRSKIHPVQPGDL